MCNAGALAAGSFAMSVAESLLNYRQASAQAKLQDKMYARNAENAISALIDTYGQLQERRQQELEASSEAIQQRRIEERKQLATARVAAGEAGVTGFSVDAILRDIGATASRDVSNIQQNRDWNLAQINQQMRGARAQAKNQIVTMVPGSSVSPWSAVFQIGKAGVDSYMLYRNLSQTPKG